MQALPEDDTYDYSSIWGEDYYSDDVNDGKSENIPTIEERINFAKYGRKVINATENEASDDTKEHIDDLPANIYCDLINTLNEKCIQVRQSEAPWFTTKKTQGVSIGHPYREQIIPLSSKMSTLYF